MTRIAQVVFGFVLGFAAIALAATKADYSGTYTAQQKGGKSGSPNPVVIHVTQTDTTIEISRTEGEKSVTNRLPLDGSEADYSSPTDKHGKGRVQSREMTCLLSGALQRQAQMVSLFVGTPKSGGSCLLINALSLSSQKSTPQTSHLL